MAAPDTILKLGDFEFAALEIPASIPFGGSQSLSTHRLVGGAKVVDAMGRDDKPLTWSGMFRGPTASDRARYIDTLRVTGLPQTLTWSTFNYLVIVREFDAIFERSYQVPYSITLEVVKDNTSPVTAVAAPPVDQAVADDATTASSLSDLIGDPTLTGLMSNVSSSIASVSSFAKAAQSTINGVLQPILAAQAQVTTLTASTENAISSVTTLGGVIPGNPVSASAATLALQTGAVQQLGNLYDLRNVLGRMQANLGQFNQSQKTVATAGGNLYQIAEEQYGDATAWTGIAAANGLTDPFVQGTQILTIPPLPANTDGVLSA